MSDFQIHLKETLSQQESEVVEKGHQEYEQKNRVICNYKPFCLTIKDEEVLIGALQGYTAYTEIYIDDIWVQKKYRGLGLGRKLLAFLEEYFEDKGFNNINLVTNAFQAKDFYLKCGFEIEFERKNKYNPNLSKIFFIKYFQNKKQNQGILPNK